MEQEINKKGIETIEKIILGFLVFFGFFSFGVIGKYSMEGHWIAKVGELSVDWGILIFTIFLLFIRYKMNKKKKEKEEINQSKKEDE